MSVEGRSSVSPWLAQRTPMQMLSFWMTLSLLWTLRWIPALLRCLKIALETWPSIAVLGEDVLALQGFELASLSWC